MHGMLTDRQQRETRGGSPNGASEILVRPKETPRRPSGRAVTMDLPSSGGD